MPKKIAPKKSVAAKKSPPKKTMVKAAAKPNSMAKKVAKPPPPPEPRSFMARLLEKKQAEIKARELSDREHHRQTWKSTVR